jgi:hypothetical protein
MLGTGTAIWWVTEPHCLTLKDAFTVAIFTAKNDKDKNTSVYAVITLAPWELCHKGSFTLARSLKQKSLRATIIESMVT